MITKFNICAISGDPMNLIYGTHNQTHQNGIDHLCEPSNTKICFINSTIRPLHTNIAPKTPATTIGFGPHYHTPAYTTVYPFSPVNQRLQKLFQPAFNGCQVTADTTTSDNPLLVKNDFEISKLLPLLPNLTLKNDTLIFLNIFYDKITLNLTASINKSHPILPYSYHIDASKSLLRLLVSSVL